MSDIVERMTAYLKAMEAGGHSSILVPWPDVADAVSEIEQQAARIADLEQEVERKTEALIHISDIDWGWTGKQRTRGEAGCYAAYALNVPVPLNKERPAAGISETRQAIKERADG